MSIQHTISKKYAAWFRLARFGLLIRWGIYTRIEKYQRVMYPERWSHKKYEELTATWRPKMGGAKQWAQVAQQAGCRYLVMTSRDFDGFCLFNTCTTDFNSVKSGPGRDLVREYVEACRAEGLRVGIHYSLHDAHNPDCDRSYRDGAARRRYVDYFHAQVRELCSNYGKLDILRYDNCWFSARDIEAVRLNAMVRDLQPEIIINNGANLLEDFSTLNSRRKKEKSNRMWELCMPATRNAPYLDQWKTPTQIVSTLQECASDGGNLLLDIEPDAQGHIPLAVHRLLVEVGNGLKKSRPSLYEVMDSNPMGQYLAGRFTARQNKLYFHCKCRLDRELVIRGLASRVLSARLMNGARVRFKQASSRLVLRDLPARTCNSCPVVIELGLNEKPRRLPGYSEEQAVRLWQRIVSEMAELQDAATSLGCQGQVLNPVFARPHIRDTASAAKIFAVEYCRTLDPEWQRRSRLALAAVTNEPIYDGLREPMYRINYWEDYVGSLFTTGLTIDAVWNTMSLLGHKFKNIPWHKFLDYLEGCRGSIGSFHHNRRQFGSDPGEKGAVGVQNTSAIALFLMEFALAQAATLRHPVLKHRSAAYRNLQNYQMKDGLWSYMFAFDRQSCDMMHHCLVLYYLAKAAATAGIKGSVRTTIRRGWQFVRQHLTTDAEGNDCINWSFEVVPKTLFGGNRYDTNAYFLILACVPWLKRLAVISERDIARTDGLVRHLVRHLMEHEGAHPCLKSHEGTEEVLSLLIANLEDSAASRGALMADWVADHLPSTRMFE